MCAVTCICDWILTKTSHGKMGPTVVCMKSEGGYDFPIVLMWMVEMKTQYQCVKNQVVSALEWNVSCTNP